MKDKVVKSKTKIIRPPERAVVGKKKGSAKAQKVAARLAAVQVLYQMKLNNQDAKSTLREFVKHRIGFKLDGDVMVPADETLLEEIVMGVHERWVDIEEVVAGVLASRKKSDVELLLACVLKAGAWELLENVKEDAGIIINDYMNVTNGFYDGTEVKLVNAVLDKIAKTVRG